MTSKSSAPTSVDIVIRPMTSADVPRIRELHAAVLPLSYPSAFFLQLLLLPRRICLVAHHRSNPQSPIGFVSAALQEPLSARNTHQKSSTSPRLAGSQLKHIPGCEPTELRIELLTLGVLPPYQQSGLGRRLVQRVIEVLLDSSASVDEAEEGALVYAHVSASNKSALKFYESMGMRVSSDLIRNMYTGTKSGSSDAYLVTGRV
ncbi:acyl-CoA N-acyltransferase [Pluteus cervinus]|uniref:Acyl-CoA N-acyltransferase n=1 Tax=Pluteus cervinus TaxID=181527 RepID=A0ACD3B938_9AGAR|nr:acyl-CoA N-acyltransferase [Pluteus cervinus]